MISFTQNVCIFVEKQEKHEKNKGIWPNIHPCSIFQKSPKLSHNPPLNILWQFVLWPNVFVAKYPCGEMSCGNLSCGKMSLWQNIHVAKCPVAICPVAKGPVAKCPVAFCPHAVLCDSEDYIKEYF